MMIQTTPPTLSPNAIKTITNQEQTKKKNKNCINTKPKTKARTHTRAKQHVPRPALFDPANARRVVQTGTRHRGAGAYAHTHSQTHARNLRPAYVGARRASPSRFSPPPPACAATCTRLKHACSAPCQIQTIFGTARSPPRNRKRKAHARSSPRDDAPCCTHTFRG